jgi:alpha-L-glutamate ligase-like protein
MVKASDILGMNARNSIFAKRNTKRAKHYADSKLAGKQMLAKAGIPTPKLLAVFAKPDDAFTFAWETLPGSFVVKPEDGNGGYGVWVIRRKARWAGEWWRADGTKVTIGDLRFHVQDILEGKYSPDAQQSRAFIEERVPLATRFRRYAYRGTPDIRVVVFNKVPVMAMLRLPTEESEGRANLHQGAIGLGVDIATGVTTYGIHNDQLIQYLPRRKSKVLRKVNGLKVPKWNQILRTAVACQEVSGLAYVGVDLVLHPTQGPMVLELNANPGMSIQLANRAGLRRRLERVKDLEVRDADHGVKIAKAIFASRFAAKVQASDEKVVAKNLEEIKIRLSKKRRVPVLAKVDTGAYRSSIDKGLAKELGLLEEDNILWHRGYVSGLGRERRPVIQITFYLKGRRIKTAVSVSNRARMKAKFLVGRRDLEGFLVEPSTEKL